MSARILREFCLDPALCKNAAIKALAEPAACITEARRLHEHHLRDGKRRKAPLHGCIRTVWRGVQGWAGGHAHLSERPGASFEYRLEVGLIELCYLFQCGGEFESADPSTQDDGH
jgi:hypothetical protein